MTTSSFTTRVSVMGMVAALALTISCSGSKTAPTPPATPVTVAPAAGPTAVLRISSDVKPALGVVGGSLTFDASESSGTGLTYSIDFGDGEKTEKATEAHVLKAGGAKVAKLTVTDREGRSSSSQVSYFVAATQPSAMAVWRIAASEPEVVVQLAQSAGQLTGEYYRGGDAPTGRRISGAVTADRRVSLKSDDNFLSITGSFEWASNAGDCLQQSCVVLRASASGGLANFTNTEFVPFDAAGVVPQVRIDSQSDVSPSFGIRGYAPSQGFDLSGSTGVGLLYRVDYDGASINSRRGTYPGSSPGFHDGVATVTDLFGRTSRRTFRFLLFDPTAAAFTWDFWGTQDPATLPPRFTINAPPDANGRVQGTFLVEGSFSPFTAVLTERRDFHLRTNDGAISLDGSFEWIDDPRSAASCRAGTESSWTQCVRIRGIVRGGRHDGRSFVFFRDGS